MGGENGDREGQGETGTGEGPASHQKHGSGKCVYDQVQDILLSRLDCSDRDMGTKALMSLTKRVAQCFWRNSPLFLM